MALKALLLIILFPMGKNPANQKALVPAQIYSLAQQANMEVAVVTLGGKPPRWVKPDKPYSAEDQQLVKEFVANKEAQSVFNNPIRLEKLNFVSSPPVVRVPRVIYVVGADEKDRKEIGMRLIMGQARMEGALVSYVEE